MVQEIGLQVSGVRRKPSEEREQKHQKRKKGKDEVKRQRCSAIQKKVVAYTLSNLLRELLDREPAQAPYGRDLCFSGQLRFGHFFPLIPELGFQNREQLCPDMLAGRFVRLPFLLLTRNSIAGSGTGLTDPIICSRLYQNIGTHLTCGAACPAR